MATQLTIADGRVRDRRIVQGLYGLTNVGEPIKPAGGKHIASILDSNVGPVMRIVHDLRDIGALKMEEAWQVDGRPGKTATWTLLKPIDEVLPMLYRRWDANDQQRRDNVGRGVKARPGRPPRIRMAGTTEVQRLTNGADHPTVYTAGDAANSAEAWSPIRHMRKDESKAIVEAVRQWRDREKVLDDHVQQIEAAGMSVDRTQLAKAIRMGIEDRQTLRVYGAVAQALPYVEDLEHANENLTRIADQRKQRIDILEGQVRNFEEDARRRRSQVAAGVPPPVLSD